MKVGDLIKLQKGTRELFKLATGVALMVEKMPRPDAFQYDWKVLVDGKYIILGRQVEWSGYEVINESR